MAESLKNKTIKGTAWSAVDNIANQGITFLVGLILARILTPNEYGLIGIIMIFVAVFNTLVDSGFSSALIRKPDTTSKDYNTVFLVNLGFSAVLFLAFYLLAPFISRFFHNEELVTLTKVSGVIIIINALAIIQRTILVKQINFKLQTKISLASSITSGVIGIGMALTGFGVWALVGQLISRQFVNTLLLWVWNKWRPNFSFSLASFKELFGFGWKLMVSQVINSIWNEIYQVVIGRFYSPAALGQYTRACQFGSIFSSNLTSVVQRVSYPVLSQIQDDKARLKEAYRKVIKTTMLVTFICMLGLAAIAEPLIVTLIGEKWLPAVPMLQIICFSMMLYPLHAINLNMLQVAGRSDLFLKLEIIKKIVAVGPVLIGIFIGIYWMLATSVVCGWFAYYLNSYYSGRFIDYSIGQQLMDILPSFVIALGMALVTYLVSFLPFPPYALLALQLAVGISLSILLLETFRLPEYLEIRKIISGGCARLSLKR